jgi:hypothetical protein
MQPPDLTSALDTPHSGEFDPAILWPDGTLAPASLRPGGTPAPWVPGRWSPAPRVCGPSSSARVGSDPGTPPGRIQVQAIDPELDPTRILQTEADVAVRSSCTTCGSPSAGADAWGS